MPRPAFLMVSLCASVVTSVLYVRARCLLLQLTFTNAIAEKFFV